jgi:hypothetical protein
MNLKRETLELDNVRHTYELDKTRIDKIKITADAVQHETVLSNVKSFDEISISLINIAKMFPHRHVVCKCRLDRNKVLTIDVHPMSGAA